MVTTSIFLHEHLALWTPLPVSEGFLEIFITRPLMPWKLALITKANLALIASLHSLRSINDALAVSSRTKTKLGVIHGLLPEQQFPVPLLNSGWELSKDYAAEAQS